MLSGMKRNRREARSIARAGVVAWHLGEAIGRAQSRPDTGIQTQTECFTHVPRAKRE